MKFKKLSAAIMVAVSSNAVMALAPSAAVDVTLTISGATAVNKQIENYVNQICDAATLDTFISAGDGARAYKCTVPAANSGLPGDRDVLFNKESSGSSAGVTPVTTGTTVDVVDLNTCHDTGLAEADAQLVNPLFAGDDDVANDGQWACSGTFASANAEVGVSDVEPELFKIADNGSKTVELNPPGGLSVFPVNAQTFGIVVSPALRDALQAAQGLVVGSDEVSEMPSLSRAIIANIFAGNVASWDSLKNDAGVGIATAAGSTMPEVHVCPRRPGSGTQAQFNAHYMKNACAYRGAGDLGFLGFGTADDLDGIIQDSDAGTGNLDVPTNFLGFPLAGPYIYESKGSSDLGKCITGINNQDFNGMDRWAIGIQSLEKVDEGRTNRNDYKFIAVDGVAPVLENVAAGLYPNWASASIQWRNDTVTGDKLVLANKLIDTARAVSAIQTFNASLQDDSAGTTNDDRPGGGFRTPEILDGGVPANVGTLAFAGSVDGETGLVLESSVPFNTANPVIPFNKGLTAPSSCRVEILVDDVDVSQK